MAADIEVDNGIVSFMSSVTLFHAVQLLLTSSSKDYDTEMQLPTLRIPSFPRLAFRGLKPPTAMQLDDILYIVLATERGRPRGKTESTIVPADTVDLRATSCAS